MRLTNWLLSYIIGEKLHMKMITSQYIIHISLKDRPKVKPERVRIPKSTDC